MIAYAAAGDVARSFVAQLNEIIIFPLIALLTVIALLVFIWGGFEYVRGANDIMARDAGRKHLLWGTVGLLVMLSAFSILSIAAGTFGLKVERNDLQPTVESTGGTTNFDAVRPQ